MFNNNYSSRFGSIRQWCLCDRNFVLWNKCYLQIQHLVRCLNFVRKCLHKVLNLHHQTHACPGNFYLFIVSSWYFRFWALAFRQSGNTMLMTCKNEALSKINWNWFRKRLGTDQARSHSLNQWWPSLLTHIRRWDVTVVPALDVWTRARLDKNISFERNHMLNIWTALQMICLNTEHDKVVTWKRFPHCHSIHKEPEMWRFDVSLCYFWAVMILMWRRYYIFLNKRIAWDSATTIAKYNEKGDWI